MNKKIVGILVCTLLIATVVLPVVGTINENNIYEDISPKPKIHTPDYFSWLDYEGQDWTTPAKDLGNCGSCWLFAAMGALESIINIREGSAALDPDLSEQYVLSCLPNAGSCSGGWAYKAFQFINRTDAWGNYHNGIIPESCFPYQADDDVPCSDKCPDWEEFLIPIIDYGYWNPDGSPEDVEAIKTQIMQTGPVVATMMFTYYLHGKNNLEEWGWEHHEPSDYYPYPGPFEYANHQVVIVGWKDDLSIGNGGYWICKNSFSTEWGYDGFFNIEYGSLNIDSYKIIWVDYEPGSVNDWVPVTDADGIYYGDVGQEITFDASGSFDHEGDITSYYWDFGDGTNDTGITVTHAYSQRGIYPVTLTVNDNKGNTGEDTTWALIDESNEPPNKPTLTGPTRGGNGTAYEYTFNAVDPDGDDVYYYLVWGDAYWGCSCGGWIGPYASGEEVTLENTWDEDGKYTVRVKAKDEYGAKSDWATLEVSMPKNKIINPFERFLENHPCTFPLLRHLMGL